MDEPWCLVASEATAPTRVLIRYYGKRWGIEAGFRDIKDMRFGMGLTPLYVKNAMGEHYGEVCSRGTEGPRFARIAFTTHGQPRPSTRFAGPPLRSGPSGDCRG